VLCRTTRTRSTSRVRAAILIYLGLPGVTANEVNAQDSPLLTRVASVEQGLGNFIEVVDERAYVTTISGLDLYDISDPSHPDLLRREPLGSAFEIAVVGNHAYVQTGSLSIVRLGSGSDMTVTGTFGSPGYSALVESNGLLFAGRVREGLEILDLTNPEEPETIGQFLDDGYYARLEVMGDVAYLGDMRDGIEVLDVSDPFVPHLLARLPGTGSIDPEAAEPELYGILVDLLVHEGLLLVGLRGSPGKLRVYDLSDPASPQQIADLEGFTKPCKMTASGNVIILSDGDNQTAVVDISDPQSPRVLGRMAGGGHDLHFDGQYLYTALENFEVFRFSPR